MEVVFLCLIMVISFLYSSVGHGGASGYLALMAIYGIEILLMRPSALMLNIFVSSIAFMAFYKGGHFRFKLLLPFIITSIPMSFLGASLNINSIVYEIILSICLVIAVFRMIYIVREKYKITKPTPLWAGLLTGAILGFVSGLIGIGGGIILSPVLILFRWATLKEAAAVSALFILLNSVSGLFGLYASGLLYYNTQLILLVLVALAGGLAGSYAGSFKFQHVRLKYILALVLLIASIKIMTT